MLNMCHSFLNQVEKETEKSLLSFMFHAMIYSWKWPFSHFSHNKIYIYMIDSDGVCVCVSLCGTRTADPLGSVGCRWYLHRSVLFLCNMQMLDRIGIRGIWRSGKSHVLFIASLELLLNIFLLCGGTHFPARGGGCCL